MAASEDLLDAVVMADDRFHGEGYREGYQEGSILGVAEGRWHGAVQGTRIGAEVAYYQGFAFTWKNLLLGRTPDDSRKVRVLESLVGLIRSFPYDDPTYERLHEDLHRIRGKFKQLCSLLNVQPDFKMPTEGSGLSF